jgi:O-antigen/teichoic acid export membrane protein
MNKNNYYFDTLVYSFTKILNMFVSIVIIMLLSRNYSLYDYGIYSQSLLITGILSNFSILGLTDGVNFFLNSDSHNEKKSKYINTLFTSVILIGILNYFLILLFGREF